MKTIKENASSEEIRNTRIDNIANVINEYNQFKSNASSRCKGLKDKIPDCMILWSKLYNLVDITPFIDRNNCFLKKIFNKNIYIKIGDFIIIPTPSTEFFKPKVYDIQNHELNKIKELVKDTKYSDGNLSSLNSLWNINSYQVLDNFEEKKYYPQEEEWYFYDKKGDFISKKEKTTKKKEEAQAANLKEKNFVEICKKNNINLKEIINYDNKKEKRNSNPDYAFQLNNKEWFLELKDVNIVPNIRRAIATQHWIHSKIKFTKEFSWELLTYQIQNLICDISDKKNYKDHNQNSISHDSIILLIDAYQPVPQKIHYLSEIDLWGKTFQKELFLFFRTELKKANFIYVCLNVKKPFLTNDGKTHCLDFYCFI